MNFSSNINFKNINGYFNLILCLLYIPFIAAQVQIKDFKSFKFHLEKKNVSVDTSEIAEEFRQIIESQVNINDEAQWAINYWNASYPSYRWHQIMMDISKAHKGHKNGGRLAIMHLSIYDSLVEVLRHKEKHEVKAPFELNDRIRNYRPKNQYSTFICEWSAAAGAASEVISYYFPDRITYVDSLIEQFKRARLKTGLQLPSDIEVGISIGKQIAEKYIAYSKTDRTDLIWQGEVPKADSLWSGKPNKWDTMKRQWRPLTLSKTDQFRPEPPPSNWTKDMEELRAFNATHKSRDIAWKWKNAPVWDNLLERKILEYDLDAFEAAFASAVFHMARFDGIIAAWDGKYHYWGIRPFQYDSEFKPILIDTPNFPGYPAGHTTVAGSIATVLSFLFPQDESQFHKLAKECSESRFEGGVHFRTDNEVGLQVGNKVGGQVIKTFLKKQK
ncbi:MAG: vanadium-dependent haloperoxidase [Bacteroidota bacterium]